MQATLNPTSEVVAQAKAHVQAGSARLAQLFSHVEDEKLTWSPSESARSALRLVAHCAITNQFFADIISGHLPEQMPSPGEFEADLHAREAQIASREEALDLLSETTSQLCRTIEGVSEETIVSQCRSPFGTLPMAFWLQESGQHLAVHAGQLAYLQTIWGDLDNHMG